jgi:hypothetical protein
VMVMPMMHMSTTDMHATPGEMMAMEEGSTGIYDCKLYYVMGSGMDMGYWELTVSIDGESAYFYPAVGMPMGSTPLFKLFGSDPADLIHDAMMGMNVTRPWYVFYDDLSSGMSPTLSLFLAAKDSFSSFPAISSGGTTTLRDENNTPWSVNTVVIEAYSYDWVTKVTAIENGEGYWSIPNLISAGTNTIYVTLSVNSDLKTSGSLTYATFTIKNGM